MDGKALGKSRSIARINGPEDLKTFEVRSGRNTVLEFGCLSLAMFLLCTNVSVREMRGMLLINEFNTVVLVCMLLRTG